MGQGRSSGKNVAKAADRVAGVAETAINAVEEAVSDAFETVGHALDDAANAAATWLRDRVPGVGAAMAHALRWAGGTVSGALDVAGAVVKGALGIVAGVLGGVIRLLGGILALDGALSVHGLLDMVSGVVGAVVISGGQAIAFVQGVLLVQAPERRLGREETKILRRVFRGSVALYNVRLIEGRAGIYSLSDRPFTLGNTIYLKDRDVAAEPGLLVHECTHVWQYQHVGARYAADAIRAQWFIENAYSWEQEIGRGNGEWIQFNNEAQGKFFENLYTAGSLEIAGSADRRGDGVFYDANGKSLGRFVFRGANHTQRAHNAVAAVRSAAAVRLSAFWS